MVEVDAAVGDGRNGLRRIVHIRFFVNHFRNTGGACRALGELDEDHGQHHERTQDRHDITEQGRELTGGKTPLHDEMRTIPTQGDDAAVHDEVHYRAVQGHERLRFHVQVEKAESRLVELPHLVMLPHEGLHDADGIDILLHDPVQGIHLEKDLLEEFRGTGNEDGEEDAQHDHRHEEDDTQFLMDEETHPEGRYHVERRPEGSPQQHLERILDAGHVGRHPRHQAGGGEFVDIREREPLDVPIHGETQVRRQAGAAVRCEPTRQDAENETQAGNPHHHRPVPVDIRQAARPDALVDDGRRHIRNQHPHDHFQRGP